MPVEVVTRGRRLAWLAARVRRSARRMLVVLGLEDTELSVLLVPDREMRRLNRTWRRRDRATDVLAFAQREGDGGAPAGLLGDVVISVDTARRQARPTSLPAPVIFLLSGNRWFLFASFLRPDSRSELRPDGE